MEKANEILKSTLNRIELAAKERDAPNGERSMARAVAIFNAWTDCGMIEADGWRFIIALKQAREIQGGLCLDDYVDLSGYPALLGECVSKTCKRNGQTNSQPSKGIE